MKDLHLLILDEPTSSLGAFQTAQLMAQIATLKKKRVSVLFISHRLGEILGVADRIVSCRTAQRVEGPNANLDQRTSRRKDDR